MHDLNPLGYLILMAGELAYSLCSIYAFILFVYLVLNLLIQFGIIRNSYKPLFGNVSLHGILGFLHRWYEPPMQAIRRKVPTSFGGIDLSPLLLFLLIHFTGYSIWWVMSRIAYFIG